MADWPIGRGLLSNQPKVQLSYHPPAGGLRSRQPWRRVARSLVGLQRFESPTAHAFSIAEEKNLSRAHEALFGRHSAPNATPFRLDEDQEVGVTLPSVNLALHPTDSRFTPADYYKEVFGYEASIRQHVDYLYMGEPLPISAHFILTLDDVDASSAQNTSGLY